jgi:hypothetical protein
MGTNPSISETLGCLAGCTDTYEVKCLQASRSMTVTIRDPTQDDGLTATLVGTSPLGMVGRSAAGETEVGGSSTATLVLVRPGAEGTMKALATVAAFASASGPRSYAIDVQCATAGGIARTSSLTLKQDQ